MINHSNCARLLFLTAIVVLANIKVCENSTWDYRSSKECSFHQVSFLLYRETSISICPYAQRGIHSNPTRESIIQFTRRIRAHVPSILSKQWQQVLSKTGLVQYCIKSYYWKHDLEVVTYLFVFIISVYQGSGCINYVSQKKSIHPESVNWKREKSNYLKNPTISFHIKPFYLLAHFLIF